MYKSVNIKEEAFQSENFSKMDFSDSEFNGCTFYSCDFTKVDFLGAIFTNCTFSYCNFAGSYITGVRFEYSDIRQCDFDDAYIFRSQFKKCGFYKGSMNCALMSTVDFTGTKIYNLLWNGHPINSPPVIIDGIEYPVVALDNGFMHVGCEYNTMDWFWNTDERHSARMEGLRARRFWKKNKKWIFDMLVARGLYSYE